MPKVRLADGSIVEVGTDALFADDGINPFVAPATDGRTFTEDDIARARQEEKDKLYTQIGRNNDELTALREQVGSLTAAEQRRAAQLEEEQTRLEAERKAEEEKDLDARTLLQRSQQEWDQRLNDMNSTWESRFEQEAEQRKQAEALAQREREFSNLREYTISSVEANKDKIAPQLLPWITGNTQEEVDAAVQRAIATTDEITAEMQQVIGQQPQIDPTTGQPVPGAPAAPALPGTRATGGPANSDPAGQQQQLTAEQIANMPMDQYAQLRSRIGVGGQGQNRGLFG